MRGAKAPSIRVRGWGRARSEKMFRHAPLKNPSWSPGAKQVTAGGTSNVLSYIYRPQVLDDLAQFGIRPGPETRPELVHDFLNDLYRYELRRLRDRLMRRDIPKPQYSAHVVELRRRYVLLSVPLRHWTE